MPCQFLPGSGFSAAPKHQSRQKGGEHMDQPQPHPGPHTAEHPHAQHTDEEHRIGVVAEGQQPLRLLQSQAGGTLAAQAVDLPLLLQLEKIRALPVVPQAELLPPVHPVQLLPEGGIVGGVEIQAGHPVGAVWPGVAVPEKELLKPGGKHQILLGRELVLDLVAQAEGLSRPNRRPSRHRRPGRRSPCRPSRRHRRPSDPRRWGRRTSRRHRPSRRSR